MGSSLLVGLLLQSVVVFDEPGFPVLHAPEALPAIADARVAEDGDALATLLGDAELLVWRHGAAFPSESWSALTGFLEAGGSLLHLGGEPFTHPVVGEPGARVVQPRTVSLLKELNLNQSYALDAGGAQLRYPRVHGLVERKLSVGATIWALEPRFSDTKDFANEDGAPGSRDALLRPLGFAHQEGADPRFPFATPSYAIDRLRGRFAGGRWVFHLADDPLLASEVEYLLGEAKRPPVDLRVDPTYGCFHEGEAPSVNVRLHRPLAEGLREITVGLVVTGPDGAQVRQEVPLSAGRHASELVRLEIEDPQPGLYRVIGFAEDLPSFETGFWVMDRELFTSGDDLRMGTWALERNGVAEPVIGTTVMSNAVHRKFLFEPNAAVWDDTFAELAHVGMNLVRTGIWSAYRKISLDPAVVDEAFLRALEGYYLSARKNGIPIVFTFFSFVPESFGGVSPYFDPRSIEGQRAYVSEIVRRFAGTKEMLWDLINEPSFASPDKLWQCRPNGDAFEHAAFVKWLEERYSGSEDGRTWEDVVRARWRLLPDEAIGVPSDDDFTDWQVMGDHRPYRAKEYAHFAQDAFRDWAKEIIEAIREAGSGAAVTVGQDEGGLLERPSPLFHADVVDFTSLHTWWFNDHLLWDTVMAKAPSKPLLISETGIMQRELLSGESIRTPTSSANLLARKIGNAFAGGAFGVVEWCYDVNPYMASDNEVAIGAKRVDGSYKPEHGVLRQFAEFFARNAGAFQGYREPEEVLLFPSGSHYSPRGLIKKSSQFVVLERAVRNSPMQVVPEYRSEWLGNPRLIHLPATPGISDEAWAELRRAVSEGSTLSTSGWFEADDAGLPTERMGFARRRLATNELMELVTATGSHQVRLSFPLDVTQSFFAVDRKYRSENYTLGEGWVMNEALPIGWQDGSAEGLTHGEKWPFRNGKGVGVNSRVLSFDGGRLVIAVNEQSTPYELTPVGHVVEIPPGECRMLLFDEVGSLVDVSHP